MRGELLLDLLPLRYVSPTTKRLFGEMKMCNTRSWTPPSRHHHQGSHGSLTLSLSVCSLCLIFGKVDPSRQLTLFQHLGGIEKEREMDFCLFLRICYARSIWWQLTLFSTQFDRLLYSTFYRREPNGSSRRVRRRRIRRRKQRSLQPTPAGQEEAQVPDGLY